MAENDDSQKAVATVGQRPISLFQRLEHEMDEMRRQMAGLFQAPAGSARPTFALDMSWSPTADAYEQDGTFVIKAELPGVKKDDVHLTLDEGLLTVEGTRTEAKDVKDARYHTSERFTGAFARTFALPEGIGPEDITAEFKDGILEIRAPLPAQAKREAITIPVKG